MNSFSFPLTFSNNQQLSGVSNSGSDFADNTSAWIDVTSLSVSLTTTGRPVMVLLPASGNGTSEGCGLDGFGGACQLRVVRGATVIWLSASINGNRLLGLPSLFIYDQPAAGTYTYKMQYWSANINNRLGGMKIFAYEFGS